MSNGHHTGVQPHYRRAFMMRLAEIGCRAAAGARVAQGTHRGRVLTQLRHDDAVQGPRDRVHAASQRSRSQSAARPGAGIGTDTTKPLENVLLMPVSQRAIRGCKGDQCDRTRGEQRSALVVPLPPGHHPGFCNDEASEQIPAKQRGNRSATWRAVAGWGMVPTSIAASCYVAAGPERSTYSVTMFCVWRRYRGRFSGVTDDAELHAAGCAHQKP